MTDDLDRILSNEPEIRPSRAFMTSVMNAVERESAVPPPIAFPWIRAMPLVVIALGILSLMGYVVWSLPSAPPRSLSPTAAAVVRSASTPAVLWMVVSLLVTAGSICAASVRAER